jgi:hypothetical protein
MANLYFPQLSSGAVAQYPIQKARIVPTVKNVMLDGNMWLLTELNFNPHAAQVIWELSYTGLSQVDVQALQSHFSACLGSLRAFTFIDPTDNMLSASGDFTNVAWQKGAIQIASGVADPAGGNQGTVLTNTSQANQNIVQTLNVPANYQYCFSTYVTSAQTGSIVLTRSGSTASDARSLSIGPSWTRVVSSGRLNDAGTTLTTGLTLTPGQQVTVYGAQLEAQLQPSRYRGTGQVGGVYPAAHWANDALAITATAPNLFSTSFSIETSL